MADSPTLDYLLGQMAQDKEVLNGSDAVLNVLESAINSFFQSQFSTLTSGSGQMTVARVFCGPKLNSPHGSYSTVTQFSFTLGAPSFAFAGGSNTVTVQQAIVSGSTKSGTMPVDDGFQPSACGCTPNDPRVTWGSEQQVNVGDHPSITAQVGLTTVTGIINADTHTVVLDFAEGAFTLNNLAVDGVSATELANQIKNWFATNEVRYQIASFDFAQGSSIPALTPTQFRLNVITTNAGNTIVQILIVTNGSPASGDPIVTEPIPTASGYTCTLMIHSRIVFSDILCAGFNGAGKPFRLYPQSQSVSEGYSAYIAPKMHFSGSFSYGSCCDKHTVTYSIYLGGTYAGSKTNGFHLSQSVTPSGNVGSTISVSANNPVSLSGSAEQQAIRITPQTPQVSVTGGASGTINSKLQAILANDFTSAMAGISFGPVTYFALRSVLFPGNLMKMSVVQVPTDLVIVGTFEPA